MLLRGVRMVHLCEGVYRRTDVMIKYGITSKCDAPNVGVIDDDMCKCEMIFLYIRSVGRRFDQRRQNTHTDTHTLHVWKSFLISGIEIRQKTEVHSGTTHTDNMLIPSVCILDLSAAVLLSAEWCS